MSVIYLRAIAVIAVFGVSTSPSVAKQVEKTNGLEHGASFLRLAETRGMERRDDRRDVRQGARQEEGLVGKDKRDAKQEGRQDSRDERRGGDDN